MKLSVRVRMRHAPHNGSGLQRSLSPYRVSRGTWSSVLQLSRRSQCATALRGGACKGSSVWVGEDLARERVGATRARAQPERAHRWVCAAGWVAGRARVCAASNETTNEEDGGSKVPRGTNLGQASGSLDPSPRGDRVLCARKRGGIHNYII